MKHQMKIVSVFKSVVGKCGVLFHKGWMRATKRDANGNYVLFDSTSVLAIWSLFLVLILESLSRHSLIEALLFLVKSPYAFAFSALLIFFTFTVALWTPIKAFLESLLSILWLAMGVANCILLLKRVTPFTANDLELITSVFRIFSVYLSVFEIVLIVLAVILALVGLVFLAIKAPRSKIKWKSALASFLIATILLPCGMALGLYTGVLSDQFPNLSEAYDKYGLVYCFTLGAFDRGIRQPKDYSEEQINEIINQLGKDQTVAEDAPNVIYLQLESFFDVNYLTNVSFSENPIPYFTQLKSEAISGFLTVPSIGAGTVNTEFEILTGMSLSFFGAGEYPYKTVLMSDTCETAAYNLKELGYTSHAIHNYEGTFYDRNLVYRNLGFDTFTSLEYMENVVYNDSGSWPKDEMLIEYIMTALSSTNTKDFVMAVSVQGHGKYPPMSLPEGYEYPIEASFIDGRLEGGLSDIAALSYYVSQLNEMDNFIRLLVDAINQFPEDVMLVMYGDHLPSLSISSSDLKNENVFQTEYVIVTNYGAEKEYENPGDLFAYQLGAVAMDVAGLHKGVLTRFHQKLRISDNYLDQLRKLEYDMLYGNRYVYHGNMNRYEAVDTVMGILPITIRSVNWNETTGVLTVYGSHFTQWSEIEIDGELYTETEYSDDGSLKLTVKHFAPESIRVVQYSPDGVILSGTDPYVYAIPSRIVPETQENS